MGKLIGKSLDAAMRDCSNACVAALRKVGLASCRCTSSLLDLKDLAHPLTKSVRRMSKVLIMADSREHQGSGEDIYAVAPETLQH